MSLALLCSGQGHQNREMFDLVTVLPQARPILDSASIALGADPADFCRTAPEPALHANREGQILCVTRALAIAAALFPTGAPPETFVAGYSVGEVAACGLASIWSTNETLMITERRARAMDAASGSNDQLCYLRGLSRPAVERLAGRFDCALAIVNPGLLFIVGGLRSSIDAFCAAALEDGAAKAAPMPIYVASHTPRLAAAVAPFLDALAAVAPKPPSLRLVSATGPALVTNPSIVLNGLARQLTDTIDWAAVLEILAERGVTQILEFGPGHALAEMAAATLPWAKVRAVDDFRSIEGIRQWLGTQ
ncbi:ACP S-malonyltransferase [Mesorhizobium hawassense]|uniref:ACP S-malonyltransferase n=1 Tax=Mesorhizobium hawassense TaxID=1209954 RepID=A0A330HUN7_9HYPH|nr:acyltransferase domain-containing protein [Mesorhizobium hawassense]RAZ92361.1 ACP S-malonyltransferase [Mesorhizobium hawassense]